MWRCARGSFGIHVSTCLFRLTFDPLRLCPEEDEHPAVQEGEELSEYQSRTQQYWIGLARSNMGPDAKDKKVAKVALAMAKVFYEDQ